MGGLIPAEAWLRKALAAGKSVVTANKQLIAYRGASARAAGGETQCPAGAWSGRRRRRAGDSRHAAGALRRPDYAHQRHRQRHLQLHPEPHGVRAPTTPTVLADAQALGYAEADPSADVDGFDARAKLCILSRIAMHAELDPDAGRDADHLAASRPSTLPTRRS